MIAEHMIHLTATRSAFFSPSIDQESVPSAISATLVIEGVDDSATMEPPMSPRLPSSRKRRVIVVFGTDPVTVCMRMGLSKITTTADKMGFFR